MFRACLRDTQEHAGKVRMDLFVGKAQDAQAMSSQDTIPLGVVLLLFLMDTAINLNHKSWRMAVEVHAESSDDLLSAKVIAAELVATKSCPEARLSRRHLLAQFLRSLELHLFHMLPSHDAICHPFPPHRPLFPFATQPRLAAPSLTGKGG